MQIVSGEDKSPLEEPARRCCGSPSREISNLGCVAEMGLHSSHMK